MQGTARAPVQPELLLLLPGVIPDPLAAAESRRSPALLAQHPPAERSGAERGHAGLGRAAAGGAALRAGSAGDGVPASWPQRRAGLASEAVLREPGR